MRRKTLRHGSINRYLNGHGDAREERVVPVEFRKKLADHLTDRYGLSTASFRVDFLFVVHVWLEPAPEIGRRLRVPNVHETEAADVGRVTVGDETNELLASQFESK